MRATEHADTNWAAPAATTAVRATVRLPGSKSITNRALILAALADTPTTIVGPLQARDTDLMARALMSLGASLDQADGGTDSNSLHQGNGGSPASSASTARPTWTIRPGWASGATRVDVGNAGTVLRFVPPAAALAAADVEFTGDPRAAQRPVGQLLAGLRQVGVEISDSGRGAVPFIVHGRGRVAGGAVTLDASSSSQLVSGLMLAAPRYSRGIQITHHGERIPSAPHIAMTAAMLTAAGAVVESGRQGQGGQAAPDFWRVRPGRLSPGTVVVEPDLSNAAPFLAAALVTGGQITIPGWPAVSLQAASQILDVLAADGRRLPGDARGDADPGHRPDPRHQRRPAGYQ